MSMSETQVATKYSGIAVTGFVCAIAGAILVLVPFASFPLLVIGLLVSVGGLVDTKRNRLHGYGLAAAGLIVSASVLISAILYSIIVG